MPDNNEQPQVIIAKPRFPLPPRIFLILGGVFLISVFGFLSFRLFFLKPSITQPQPPAAPEVQKITIPCPTDAIFCQNAKPDNPS